MSRRSPSESSGSAIDRLEVKVKIFGGIDSYSHSPIRCNEPHSEVIRNAHLMQNRYVGDVGDFGTYGLLRALVGEHPKAPGFRPQLGVHWYMVPDEIHNDDGKHVDYLKRSRENLTRFRVCDPKLFDRLEEIVARERNVAAVQRGSILPESTKYFGQPLSFRDLHGLPSRAARLSRRTDWTAAAIRELQGCDVVFFDPDNGLEGDTASYALSGPKYVYHDELKAFVEPGRSLVVYQHLGRRGSAIDQIRSKAEDLEQALHLKSSPLALQYHRGSPRVFLIAANGDQAQMITARVRRLLHGPWRRHFAAPLGLPRDS
jgi:hypothetical protein